MYWLSEFIIRIYLSNFVSNSYATTDAMNELQKVGFEGVATWAIGIIVMVFGFSASFVIASLINRSASHISNNHSSPRLSQNVRPQKIPQSKQVFVKSFHGSPVVYSVRYRLDNQWASQTQVYKGLSFQFDWKSFSWHLRARGYYRNKSISSPKYSGLSLDNAKFSARVFDYDKGVWRYELRKPLKSNKRKRSYQSPVVAHATNKENLVAHSGGYVNPATGEFFPSEDITDNVRRNDFDIDEINMLFASAASEQFN